ncbi:unnamed protein product [Dracunculus medinensis]|uniref:L-gulonate 3-dehydrogenase n=1 Tax=Dracunculus medinensis TaxID=318479 RepID=A0A0N4UHV6_DRAME|nr:unnamed protein product [Dracunculus medinensis]
MFFHLLLNSTFLFQLDNLLRCDASTEDQLKNVTVTDDLGECLKGSFYCQESITEDLAAKKAIFAKLDEIADMSTILASSTSTIPASLFTENLKSRSRCLVVHPINPPIYIPLVEIVPSPWTSDGIVSQTVEIMRSIRQSPVCLKKEIFGFALNRLQYAINAEAWRLVKEGILCPEDVDTVVMKDGLGPRYAFYGPLETMHLNAKGIENYIYKYSDIMRNVLESFGPIPSFNEAETMSLISETMNNQMPITKMRENLRNRERKLAELCKLKHQLNADVQNGL